MAVVVTQARRRERVRRALRSWNSRPLVSPELRPCPNCGERDRHANWCGLGR